MYTHLLPSTHTSPSCTHISCPQHTPTLHVHTSPALNTHLPIMYTHLLPSTHISCPQHTSPALNTHLPIMYTHLPSAHTSPSCTHISYPQHTPPLHVHTSPALNTHLHFMYIYCMALDSLAPDTSEAAGALGNQSGGSAVGPAWQ